MVPITGIAICQMGLNFRSNGDDANFRLWLQADLQPPEIDFRLSPNFGHSVAHAGLPVLTLSGSGTSDHSSAKLMGCRVAESRFERELIQRCLQSPQQMFGNLPVYPEFGIGLKGTHRGLRS